MTSQREECSNEGLRRSVAPRDGDVTLNTPTKKDTVNSVTLFDLACRASRKIQLDNRCTYKFDPLDSNKW